MVDVVIFSRFGPVPKLFEGTNRDVSEITETESWISIIVTDP